MSNPASLQALDVDQALYDPVLQALRVEVVTGTITATISNSSIAVTLTNAPTTPVYVRNPYLESLMEQILLMLQDIRDNAIGVTTSRRTIST